MIRVDDGAYDDLIGKAVKIDGRAGKVESILQNLARIQFEDGEEPRLSWVRLSQLRLDEQRIPQGEARGMLMFNLLWALPWIVMIILFMRH